MFIVSNYGSQNKLIVIINIVIAHPVIINIVIAHSVIINIMIAHLVISLTVHPSLFSIIFALHPIHQTV